jgi:mitochondrial fission protein ELM1
MMLSFVFKKRKPSDSSVDIVIGTGSNTHAIVIELGKLHKARTVTCMSPFFPLQRFFDLCCVPEHDGVTHAGNILETVGPPNLSVNHNRHDSGRGLILIGGVDEKSHIWNSDNILWHIEKIIKKDCHIKWVISSSPRTPEDMEKKLSVLSNKNTGVDFLRFSDTQSGWIEKQYSVNQTVWVTADSMSMVYEALSAGCRVGIIPVEWKNKKGKFACAERKLIEKNFVTPYVEWLNSCEFIHSGKNLNEAQKCAREILIRWWIERLQ